MVDAIVMDELNAEYNESELPVKEQLNWPETLRGVLTSPEKTFSYMLHTPDFFNDQKATQSFFLVFLIGLASGLRNTLLRISIFCFYHSYFIGLFSDNELDDPYLFAFWIC